MAFTPGGRRGRDRAAGHAAAKLSNGGGALGAWWPRGHKLEYVACVAVPDLESIFRIIHMDSDLGACTKVVAL